MAVKVTGLISPNSGQYAIEAQHVAFTPEGGQTTTVQAIIEDLIDDIADLESQSGGGGVGGDASTIIYEGQTTIKQKIQSLESGLGGSADNVTYSYTIDNNGTEETVTTTVKAVLDALRAITDQIGNITTKVNEAQAYSTSAQSAAQTAQAAQLTITSTINDKIAEMTQMNNDTASRIQGINVKIDTLQNIASQLQSVFEADGQFVILSNAEYQQRCLEEYDEQAGTGISPTTIYLCYDEAPAGSSYYSLQLSVGQDCANWGQVIGQGSYAQGSQVIIVALPKTGYQFSYWSDSNTQNPRTIVMNADKQYIAYFEQITNSEPEPEPEPQEPESEPEPEPNNGE